MLKTFDDGRAVVLDGNGNVLRQLVAFERTRSGKTKFAVYFAPLVYPTKKAATQAARQMGWPLDRVERGRALLGDFWFIRNDFRDQYALACWDASAPLSD